MKDNRRLYYIAFLVIVVVFSIVSFVLIENKDGYFWSSYIFTLIAAIGVFISGFFFSKGKLKNFPAEFSFVSIAAKYLVAEIVIVILFGIVFRFSVKIYVCLHIVALACAIFIAIFMIIGRNKIVDTTEETRTKVTKIRMMAADIDAVMAKAQDLNPEIRNGTLKLLNNLYEDIRFSDPMVHESLSKMDAQIEEDIKKVIIEVERLTETKSTDLIIIQRLIENLRRTIIDRNNRTKILK